MRTLEKVRARLGNLKAVTRELASKAAFLRMRQFGQVFNSPLKRLDPIIPRIRDIDAIPRVDPDTTQH